MNRFAKIILKFRIPILLVTLAGTLWLASYIPRIRFDSSSDGSVPQGDPEQAFFEETIETFGNDQVSMVVVDVPDGNSVFNRPTLEKIERLTRQIEKIDGVEEVISLTNARYLTGAGDMLETPLVIPEIPDTPEGMTDLSDFVLNNDLFLKTLVSGDGRAAALNIFVRDYPDSVLIALDIDGKIQQILETEQGPEILHYAGLTYTRRVINATMHRDLRVFIPITLVLITLVLFLTFRSVRGVVLPLLTVVIGTACTVGLLGLFNKPMSLVMTILPPLMIAIGSSYSIHVVSHFNENIRNNLGGRDSALHTLRDLTMPMAMTALTTIIGFGSLVVNPIPNIRKMGIFAMIGIAFTFLIAITVLPAILSFFRSPRLRTRKKETADIDIMDRFLGWLAGFNERRRLWITVMVILVSIVSVWGLLAVRVDTNFLSYFDEESDIRKTTDIISEKLAGASTFFLVVDGKEPDSMKGPDVLRSVDRIQKYMEDLPGVDKTVSIVGHLKRLHSALNYDDPDSLIVPGNAGVIAEELLLFTISHDPGAMERYVNGDFSEITVFARTSLVGSSEILGTLKEVEEYAAKELPPGFTAKPTGTLVVLTHATEAVSRGQRNSLVLALMIIFVVMSILFRSLRAGFVSMIPNALPILIVFGMMGWSGTTLNLGTSIIACTAIGIAVDDTIHFMTDFGRRMRKGRNRRQAAGETLRSIGRPMVYTSITLFFGFLILSLSNFEMISSVGFLTGITMLTALGGDLVLLPILLISMRSIDEPSLENSEDNDDGGIES